MELLETKQNTYSTPCVDTRLISDVAEEFSLADYYPEVRRVISVTAKAIPEGKFISGNQIDCDGTVAFTVTYLGDDGEITAVPFNTPYTQSATLPDCEGEMGEIVCLSTADSAACRVIAPRRLSLKAHVTTRLFADERKSLEVRVKNEDQSDAASDAILSVEKSCSEVPTVRLFYGAANGSVEGEISDRNCCRAVSADAVINVTEAKAQDGFVAVRAETIVMLLSQDQNGTYFPYREKVSFDTQVPVEGCAVGDRAVASAVTTLVEVNMEDNGMSFLVEYDMDAQAARTENVEICTDAYSTEYEGHPITEAIRVLAPLKVGNFHLTQTGEQKRHGEASPADRVIQSRASASADELTVSDGKLTLSGTLNVQIAIAGEDDVSPEEGKIPFTFVTEAPDGYGCALWQAAVQVIDVFSRIDGGQINVTAELAISLSVLGISDISAASGLMINRSLPRGKQNGIKIYFPEEGEDVWSIAKRYGACRRTLEKLNGWQEGTKVPGNSPVIIE